MQKQQIAYDTPPDIAVNLMKAEEKNKFFSSRSDSEIGYTVLGNLCK